WYSASNCRIGGTASLIACESCCSLAGLSCNAAIFVVIEFSRRSSESDIVCADGPFHVARSARIPRTEVSCSSNWLMRVCQSWLASPSAGVSACNWLTQSNHRSQLGLGSCGKVQSVHHRFGSQVLHSIFSLVPTVGMAPPVAAPPGARLSSVVICGETESMSTPVVCWLGLVMSVSPSALRTHRSSRVVHVAGAVVVGHLRGVRRPTKVIPNAVERVVDVLLELLGPLHGGAVGQRQELRLD